MKKTLLLTMLLCVGYLLNAQVSKTINVTTAGTLTTLLTASQKTTVTNLTVTGSIDARDVKCMRDEMTVLAVVDMGGANIVEYNGYSGTSSIYANLANQMPANSFYNDPNGKLTLKSITLPASLTSIGFGAFQYCLSLTEIIIPNSVTSIAMYAFSDCKGLKSVTLPSSLKTIANYAFYRCSGLKYLSPLPISLTSIGDYAFFATDTTIKLVTCLGSTPASIGTYAFSSPLAIYVPIGALTAYRTTSGWSGYNVIAEKHVTINNPTAGGLAAAIITSNYGPLTSITHLTVTGFVNATDIASMKTNYTNLASINLLGVSLENNELPNNAFENKTMLVSITLPETVVSIGSSAFKNCTNLSCSVPLPTSVKSIGNEAYYNCGNLTGTLIIPEGVKSIGNNTFWCCRRITGSLTIPDNVTTIGSNAFFNCIGINGNLTLPQRLTSINSYAFDGCNNLSGVLTIPSSVTNIGTNAFNGLNGLTELEIGSNTASIGNYAFGGCTGLAKISLAKSLPPTIVSNTFYGVNKANCSLVVPSGSKLSYQIADYWSSFDLVSEYGVATLVPSNINTSTTVYTTNKTIVVVGAEQGQTVTIYNINGALLQSEVSQGDTLTIPVKAGAIYLVKVGMQTFKVAL